MNKLTIILSSLLVGTILFAACGNEKVTPPNVDCLTLENTYTGEVSDILQASCMNCHATGSSAAPFPLETYAQHKIYLDNGLFSDEVLEAGGRMAAWGNMTEDEIEIVRCWFDAGYPEN